MRVLAFVAVLAIATVPAFFLSQHKQAAWPKDTGCGQITRHDGSVIHFALTTWPFHESSGPCPFTAAYVLVDSQ